MLEDRDRYAAAVQLIVVTESTSWNRFNIFLVFYSLLIISWTSIHTHAIQPVYAAQIKISLSILCILSGVLWAGIGWRARTLQKYLVELGKQLEDDNPRAAERQVVNPCSTAAEKRDTLYFKYAGSYYLLTCVPLSCAILSIFLLIASF